MSYDEFLSILADDTALTPGIGFIFFFLVAFTAVVGPLNYFFLRKRKAPGLYALSVPSVSVAFLLVVLFAGLAVGRKKAGSRLTILETVSGQEWASSASPCLFRSGRGGEYGFTAREGSALYPMDTHFRLDQSGKHRLFLSSRRGLITAFQADWAERLGGGVSAEWEGEEIRVSNRLPFDIEGGMIMAPSEVVLASEMIVLSMGGEIEISDEAEVFTRGIDLTAGDQKRFGFNWEADKKLSRKDKLLVRLLWEKCCFMKGTYLACWLSRKFEHPGMDGGEMPLAFDRTVLILPVEGEFDPQSGKIKKRQGKER